MLPNIELGDELGYLVKNCQTQCTPECCGINAFVFSPMNIAIHFYRGGYTGIVSYALGQINNQLRHLETRISRFKPNANSYVCRISDMDVELKFEDVDKMINEIKANMKVAQEILVFAENISKNEKL